MPKTVQQQKQVFSTPTSKRARNEQTPVSSNNKSPKIVQLIEMKFARQNEIITAKIEECVKKSVTEAMQVLEHKIEIVSNELKDLSLRVTNLEIAENNIVELKSELSKIKDKLSHQENLNVATNLRMCGIPFVEDENLHDIFNKLCAFLNMPVPQVKSIHRIRNKSANQSDGVILAKLCTPRERNTLLKTISYYRRESKSQLTLNILGFNSNTPFFINEDLTTDNYNILQASLKLKRKKLINTSFTMHGIVYIKFCHSDRPIRIHSTQQLRSLFREDTQMSNSQTCGDGVVKYI